MRKQPRRTTLSIALKLLLSLLVVSTNITFIHAAENHDAKVDRALKSVNCPGMIRSAIGVTRSGTTIPSLITGEDFDYSTTKKRVLIIGGIDGTQKSVDSVLNAMQWFYKSDEAKEYRERIAVSCIPIANPDGWATGKRGENLSGGRVDTGYPPTGTYYNSAKNPEAQYLWRWIGMHAPDLVVDVRGEFRTFRESVPTQLTTQLSAQRPSNIGTIPAEETAGPDFLKSLCMRIAQSKYAWPKVSPARREMQRRIARTPVQVATQLSKHYGHDLNSVAYIPALALIGRIRLGELTKDGKLLADVEKIVAPYFNGSKPTLPKRVGGSHLSGHLVFCKLARRTNKKRYVDLARVAADLGFNEDGALKPNMPFHNEMSDSVFMGCPILVQVGRLTGETNYYDMAMRHMRFMLDLNVREDGIHRHSPLCDTAWGRGNGFPALGLALCLTDLPEDYSGRAEMLKAYRSHMAALAKYQDPTGAWHQVVDRPGSYRELSSTCMITFAMIRGVRMRWLDKEKYEPIINKGWKAIKTRVAPDGTLVDMCTGTGKQKSLRDYFDRTAILGRDARGGAMSLMVSTEISLFKIEEK